MTTRRRTAAVPQQEDDLVTKGPQDVGPVQTPTRSGYGVASALLDASRVLLGLLLLSSLLSWFVTGNSVLWGYRPWYTRWDMVNARFRGPVSLTDAELVGFNGADAQKPIYLALDGDIYDVSEGRRIYGPGGSYHHFAGRDAARAFVTGCFDTDLTPDLRGVEEAFVPIEEPADQTAPKAELKLQRERDNRAAKKKVRQAIDGWKTTFKGETGRPYFWVGRVKREKGWLEKLPQRELCEAARKARPRRDDPPRS